MTRFLPATPSAATHSTDLIARLRRTAALVIACSTGCAASSGAGDPAAHLEREALVSPADGEGEAAAMSGDASGRDDAVPAPADLAAGVSAADVAWLPDAVLEHRDAIDDAARRHGVDPRLVAIIVLVESSGNPDAVSSRGATGLMQLMPATAAHVAATHGLSAPSQNDLKDVSRNLELGVLHLADLVADFGDASLDAPSVHRVATAYNGGEGVVLGHRTASEETTRYAARVSELWAARDAARLP